MPQDLKPRTKAFALRVIQLYSLLPKNDPVAQVLGKQVLRSGKPNARNPRQLTSEFWCNVRKSRWRDLEELSFKKRDTVHTTR